MVKSRHFKLFSLFVGCLVGLLTLLQPATTQAGIYNASGEVTYKEYWAVHTIEAGFTGGCPVPNPPEEKNRWYIEPGSENSGCTKPIKINIPDNVQGALRAEIYVDFWRNQQQGATSSARFRINNSATVYNPPIADDWARSPYITAVPLNQLVQGENIVNFWTLSTKLFHVHDVVIRVYYDDAHPLVAGSGSDVTPPTGALTAVGGADPNNPDTLNVDSNTLVLQANAGNGASLVEFHGFYEGYDEDNDHEYRDWHNRTIQNCFPGGVASTCSPFSSALGATADHIGTAAAVSPVAGDTRDDNCSWGATVSCTWNLGHITNQAGVRFKIRILDGAGNVREAAGGISAPFKLLRNSPTAAFLIPNFDSFPLKSAGAGPNVKAVNLNFPTGTRALFDKAYLIHSLWSNPELRVNSSNQFDSFRSTESSWALSIRDTARNNDTLPLINTLFDTNIITYSTRLQSYGEFIEYPGPMIVLRRNAVGGADNTNPTGAGVAPAAGATGVREDTNIVVSVSDTGGVGVDRTSLVLRVNGQNVTNQTKVTGFSNEYILTYNPANNFANNQTVGVEVQACDLRNNCMANYTYSFTVRAPDNSAPTISNIGVTVGPTFARISWTTDEPATSVINYGLTTSYGLNFSNATLVTQHSVLLEGLASLTTYNFQITSVDEAGNPTNSENQTFLTRQSGALQVDDFNYCELDSNVWEFINPRNDATLSFIDGQKLKISVPAGVAHDPAPSGSLTNAAPRIMQNSVDPNGLKVKFETGPTQETQQQGVIIEQDANNYMVLSLQLVNGKTMFYASKVGGSGGNLLKSYEFATGAVAGPLYMNIEYKPLQNRWRVTVSAYEDGTEGDPGGFNYTITVNRVGFFAGNGSAAPAFDAIIDYVDDIDAPLTVEDATALTVGTDAWPVGKGTVTAENPCGETIVLSAQPKAGWSFTGWSGVASGTNLTVTVPAAFGSTAVANFVQNTYTVEAAVVGNGSVTKSPDRPEYIFGSLVKLRATPTDGWRFTGWSGDATGTTNPLFVSAAGSKLVTANFVEIRSILTATKVGNGQILVSPVQPDYGLTQEITVTAVPDPGWSFAGWSGDVTATTPTINLTMASDKTLVATFTQDNYTLTVNKIGEGSFTVNPQKATYLFGDEVTLTATPANGWNFIGWSGAVTASNGSVTVVMNGNTTITANFAQNQYTLTTAINGQGSITVTPEKATYTHGEEVTLNVTPDPSWNFVGWTGDVTSNARPLVITMDGNKSVTANFQFVEPGQVTLTVNTTGKGTFTVSPALLASYPVGTELTLTAVPDEGWLFSAWGGDVNATTSAFKLIMDTNKVLTLTFTQKPVILTIPSSPDGTVQRNPEKSTYLFGEKVTLTATPQSGYVFDGWVTVDGNGVEIVLPDNPLTITLTGDTTYTPRFVEVGPLTNAIYLPLVTR